MIILNKYVLHPVMWHDRQRNEHNELYTYWMLIDKRKNQKKF